MSRLSPRNVLSSEAIRCTISQLLPLNKQSKSSLAYNNKHINTLIGLRIGWEGSASDFESEVQLQWLCFTFLSFSCSQGCFFLVTITEIQEAKAKPCDFCYCQCLEQIHYHFLPCSIDQSKWHGQAHTDEAEKYTPTSDMKFKVTWQKVRIQGEVKNGNNNVVCHTW